MSACMQAVTSLATQGQLKANMLTALAELPFELAVHAFQAAFELEALQDINKADTDARLYDAATKAVSSEKSLEMLCGAVIRSDIC